MAIHIQTGETSKGVAILPSGYRSKMADYHKLCAICQKEYYPTRPKEWFCNSCYHTWNKEIRERQPWVKFCIASELSRRRQDTKLRNFMFLGDRWDIDDKGNLVTRDGYNG